jgi:hypothetical protein
MSKAKMVVYGNYRVPKIFIPFLENMNCHPYVQNVSTSTGFIRRGNSNSGLKYEVRNFHPDQRFIRVLAQCRNGKQYFRVVVKSWEIESLCELKDFIESYT